MKKKKILFMSMPDIYQPWHEAHIIGPAIAGASLAGNSKPHGVYVADLVLKRKDLKVGIDEAIKETNPDLIGLSSMTFQYPTTCRIANYIKSNYGLPIAFGGYHVTALREEVAEEDDGNFDFLFAGPSEITFKKFLGEEDMKNISGLSYKKNGKWIHNKRTINQNGRLEDLALPDRDSRIWEGYHFHGRPYDTLETSRSCNHNCEFCSVKVMYLGIGHIPKQLEKVILDIKTAQKRGTKAIFHTDDNPAMRKNDFETYLNTVIKENLNSISYSGTVSAVSMQNPKTTDLMRKAGWEYLFLGVENNDPTNLKNMNKPSNIKIIETAIKNLYNSGISVLAGLIVGNPDDTKDSISSTLQWAGDLKGVDVVMPQYLTPYPKTPIRKKLEKQGLLVNKGGLNENGYGGWSTYNGAFAHCATKSGLMPYEIEEIVVRETRKNERKRAIKFFQGKLNIAKNNPKHMIKWVAKETIPNIPIRFKQRKLNDYEVALREREMKIEMNKFNI